MERIRLISKRSPDTLPTESTDEFQEERRAIRKALRPQNKIAEIYAKDFASDTWLASRMRRAQSQTVKRKFPDALFDLLRELGVCEVEATELTEGWLRQDPVATVRVNAILKIHGCGEQDIEGDAVRRSLAELILGEQVVTSSVSRRDKALIMFAFANQIGSQQSQENVKAAVADTRMVRLERPRRKAG
jgi:hypothetical protein